MLFIPLCASLLLIEVLPLLPAVNSMELDELVMDFSFHVLTNKHLFHLLDTHDNELNRRLMEAKAIFEERRNAPNDEQKHKFVSAMVEAMFNLSAKNKDMNFVPNVFKQWLKNAKKQELERKELLKEAAEDEWEFVHDDLALAKFNAFVMNNFPMGGGDVLSTIAPSLHGKANSDGNRLVDVLVIFNKLCINLQQHGHGAHSTSQSHQPEIAVLDHRKAQWWLNLLAAHIEATMQAIEDEAEKRIADKGHHDQHHHDHTPHHQPPPLRNIDADVEGFMAQNPFLNEAVFAMFPGPQPQEQQQQIGRGSAGTGGDQQTAGAGGVHQSLLGNIRDEWIKKPPMPDPKPDLKPEPKLESKSEPKSKAEPMMLKQSDAQNLIDSGDWTDVDDYAKEKEQPEPESKSMKIGGDAGGSQSHGQAPPSAAGGGGDKTLSDSWTDVDDFAKEQPEPKPMPKKDGDDGQSSGRKSPSKRKDKNPGK